MYLRIIFSMSKPSAINDECSDYSGNIIVLLLTALILMLGTWPQPFITFAGGLQLNQKGKENKMPLRSVDLCDYLLSNPVTIRPDENIFHAIDVIIKNKISGVCVVDNNGHLQGR